MTLRRSQRTRTLPGHLRDFLLERHLKNAAVLPALRPAAPVPPVGECLQEEPLSIHGRSVEEYQGIYRSVMDSTVKKPAGRYTLQKGLEVKQRLWEKLGRPALLETEQPDGRVLITEIRSESSVPPQIKVDISKEPLPKEPRRKRPRH